MIADPNKNTLIIVESPTKAKTIKRYLPSSCTVMASKGHIKDLAVSPSSGVYGVDVDKDYELEYDKLSADKERLVREMKEKLKNSEQLVLASDEDREGESIAYHLLKELKPKCPVYRMVFHEITKSAIRNAFSSCREINMDLVHAQEARRVVDRLHGYGISPIVSKKLGKNALSAGRVQSPALRLLVDRENERRRFISADYASVEADLGDFKARLESVGDMAVADKKAFDPKTGKEKKGYLVLSQERAAEISDALKGADAVVSSVSRSEKTQFPSVPFTTSTLQQDASRKLRKGVRDVMRIAQSLYEQGFITYMRTDSPTLSQECINASRSQILSLYGDEYLSDRPRNYSARSAVAQEAHEAIRPAGDTFRLPKDTGLSGDELKLYTLIWKRTIATQMTEARKSTTTVHLKSGEYGLVSSGTTILFDGYLRVYSVSTEGEEDLVDDEERSTLPQLEEGETRTIVDASYASHSTEPPQRYNEATLVKMLESEGIGRPSTYATIISTILDRGYALKSKNSLVPTFTGYFVANFLLGNFPLYVGYEFTKNMEDGLDKVARGEESKKKYLDDFWKGEGDFHGLKADLSSVSRTVRIGDSKNLQLEGLSYRFVHDGRQYSYQIRISKFGPYISFHPSDNPDASENAGINESQYFPGEFSDDDAMQICFQRNEQRGDEVVSAPGYVLEKGKFGPFLRRVCDGSTANAPKTAKADTLSQEEVDLLFSLPKVLGEDENGKAELRLGPYGYYVAYNGSNYKVFKPLEASMETVRKLAEPKKAAGAAGNQVLRELGEVDGEKLQLVDGRYGVYIKWGRNNIPLSEQEKKNPDSVTAERAAELARSFVPRKKNGTGRRK